MNASIGCIKRHEDEGTHPCAPGTRGSVWEVRIEEDGNWTYQDEFSDRASAMTYCARMGYAILTIDRYIPELRVATGVERIEVADPDEGGYWVYAAPGYLFGGYGNYHAEDYWDLQDAIAEIQRSDEAPA